MKVASAQLCVYAESKHKSVVRGVISNSYVKCFRCVKKSLLSAVSKIIICALFHIRLW